MAQSYSMDELWCVSSDPPGYSDSGLYSKSLNEDPFRVIDELLHSITAEQFLENAKEIVSKLNSRQELIKILASEYNIQQILDNIAKFQFDYNVLALLSAIIRHNPSLFDEKIYHFILHNQILQISSLIYNSMHIIIKMTTAQEQFPNYLKNLFNLVIMLFEEPYEKADDDDYWELNANDIRYLLLSLYEYNEFNKVREETFNVLNNLYSIVIEKKYTICVGPILLLGSQLIPMDDEYSFVLDDIIAWISNMHCDLSPEEIDSIQCAFVSLSRNLEYISNYNQLQGLLDHIIRLYDFIYKKDLALQLILEISMKVKIEQRDADLNPLITILLESIGLNYSSNSDIIELTHNIFFPLKDALIRSNNPACLRQISYEILQRQEFICMNEEFGSRLIDEANKYV